jgi:hypothetical protein
MAMSNRFRDVIYHLERHKKTKEIPPQKNPKQKNWRFCSILNQIMAPAGVARVVEMYLCNIPLSPSFPKKKKWSRVGCIILSSLKTTHTERRVYNKSKEEKIRSCDWRQNPHFQHGPRSRCQIYWMVGLLYIRG